MIDSHAHLLFITFIASAGVSAIILFTKKWHGKFSLDSQDGLQKFHKAPTPRIGGIALFSALIVACFIAERVTGTLLALMLLASLPAFIAGLVEDFTKRAGVRERLLATIVSGLLAIMLTGYHIDHVDIPLADLVFAFTPFAVLFTAFAISGVANAINIIDGFNGLACGVMMIFFAMFGVIAWQVGDREVFSLCILFILSIAGFMLFNFPFGKIFMGDGGAYFMGFMLAWTAVLLPMRNHEVSPLATVIICSYPVIETLFSMWRKSHRKGHHPGQPDRVHFHMLIYQRVSRALFFGWEDSLVNGLTSIFIYPFAFFCALSGVVYYSSTVIMIISFIVCSIIYYLIYLRLTQFRWCLKPVKSKKRNAVVKIYEV